MNPLPKAILVLLFISSGANALASDRNFITGQAKMPSGRAFSYQYDPDSNTFGADAKDFINVKVNQSAKINLTSSDCDYWDEIFKNIGDIRDAYTTLTYVNKPKYDIKMQINLLDPYLQSQVADAVSASLAQHHQTANSMNNGTDIENLDGSVSLIWSDSALTKLGRNNLQSNVEAGFEVEKEKAADGSVVFNLALKNMDQYVACDFLRKRVGFAVTYKGESFFHYQTKTKLNVDGLSRTWSDLNASEPLPDQIRSSGTTLTYREIQFVMAGARLAMSPGFQNLSTSGAYSAHDFFALINGFIDLRSVAIRPDFEHDVLPRIQSSFTKDQKISVSKLNGEINL